MLLVAPYSLAYEQSSVRSPSKKLIASTKTTSSYNDTIVIEKLSEEGNHLLYSLKGPFIDQQYTSREIVDIFWATDDEVVYFAGRCSDTSACLFAVDLRTGQLRMLLHSAEEWEVINAGKYAGCLVVKLRKFTLIRKWSWYWLYTKDGEMIDAIGDINDLVEFMKVNVAKHVKPTP